MKSFIVFLALFAGQMMTHQDEAVVRLQPHRDSIEAGFGGKMLQLSNAPAIVRLPISPPRLDEQGNPWKVDVKNLGPGAVTVVDKSGFKVQIPAGQTVHIYWNGTVFSLHGGGSL